MGCASSREDGAGASSSGECGHEERGWAGPVWSGPPAARARLEPQIGDGEAGSSSSRQPNGHARSDGRGCSTTAACSPGRRGGANCWWKENRRRPSDWMRGAGRALPLAARTRWRLRCFSRRGACPSGVCPTGCFPAPLSCDEAGRSGWGAAQARPSALHPLLQQSPVAHWRWAAGGPPSTAPHRKQRGGQRESSRAGHLETGGSGDAQAHNTPHPHPLLLAVPLAAAASRQSDPHSLGTPRPRAAQVPSPGSTRSTNNRRSGNSSRTMPPALLRNSSLASSAGRPQRRWTSSRQAQQQQQQQQAPHWLGRVRTSRWPCPPGPPTSRATQGSPAKAW